MGATTVSNHTWEKCLISSQPCLRGLLKHREYVRRLETVAKDQTKRKLPDKDLLEIFLQPENVHLYQDIETVMSVMVRAALLNSVESIVESWISTMEHHSSQRRTMSEGLTKMKTTQC